MALQNVLIVEDEPHIAKMISHLINWDSLGLSSLGICEDGQDALDTICGKHPDIVIADIHIPGIDGIELIGRARSMGIGCDFVIISGYSQFEYAQKAISYGVHDYLIKPINQAELNAVLGKIVAARQKAEQRESALFEKNRMLRKSFMEAFLRSGYEARSLEELAAYGLTMKPGMFQCAVIKVDIGQSAVALNTLRDVSSIALQCTKAACYDVVRYILQPNTVYILCNYPKGADLADCYAKMFEDFQKSITNQRSHRFSITIGVGTAFPSLNNMNLSFTAHHAARYRLQNGANCIYYYDKLQFDQVEAAELFTQRDKQKLANYADLLSSSAVQQQLEELFKKISCRTPPAVVKSVFDAIIMTIAASLTNMASESNGNAENAQTKNFMRAMEDMPLERAKTALLSWCRSTFEEAAQQRLLRGSRPVNEAKAYIEENYASDLKLESVADFVHLTPPYLSAVFKKETGLNFSDYLAMHRIQVAKTLLRTTEMSVAQISEKVGYKDSRYFSKVFTKITGAKPSSYRKYM